MRQQHLQTPQPASFSEPHSTENATKNAFDTSSDTNAAFDTSAALEDQITSVVAEERLQAEQTTSNAASIVDQLQKEAVSRKREGIFTTFYMLVSLLPVLYITRAAVQDYAALQRQFVFWALFSVVSALGMMWLAARRSFRRKRVLARELEKPHDITTVGLLVDTLKVDATQVRNLTKQALITLLPTLRANDGALLNEKQRDILLRQLAISPADKGYRDLTELFSRAAYQRELALRLSILKAFEQVGGAKELPVVERLSRGLPTLHSGTRVPAPVRQAASECLPYLQSRANEQRASEQLLRASSAHDTANAILLRPASSQSDALPEQLLRASEARAS